MKIKNINEINFKYGYDIDYGMYKYYIYIINLYSKTKKKSIEDNKYDKLCNLLLSYMSTNSIDISNIINIKDTSDEKYWLYSYMFDNIKSKNNLLITNYKEVIIQLSDIINDIYFFENEEINNKTMKEKLENLNRDIKIQKLYDITPLKIYDNVIIKINEFSLRTYLPYLTLTKIPNYIGTIAIALKSLKKGADLYLFFRIGIVNNTYKKIFHMLSNLFTLIEIKRNNSDIFANALLIHCKEFNGNIDNSLINKLLDITKKTYKYNYSICQFMNYFYYTAKKNVQFMYNLNVNDFTNLKQPNNINNKTMGIVDDIDINPEETLIGNYIISYLNIVYKTYFERVAYNIKKYVHIKNNKYHIDNEFLNRLIYHKLIVLIDTFKKMKIPYNKTYLAYIGKYNENIVNEIYSFRGAFKYPIIAYPSISTKKFFINLISKLDRYKSYHYDQLTKQQEMFDLAYKVTENLLETIGTNKKPKDVLSVTEDLTRGVARYITQNYKMEHSKITNGFVKLWEIYSMFPTLIPNKKDVKIFHIAEAPGQWIYATNHFCSTKKDNIENIDWRANSLNPYNQVNIKKYGKPFGDDYGFIKKYKKQWLWGADNTGDITNLDNQKWYRQYSKEWGKVDLVTSDAGIPSDNPIINQRLELAQICMVAGVSSKGSNCVIKHFLPYVRKIPETATASGNFMSMLMLYYIMFNKVFLIKPITSNPDSGEFYVVGRSFRGMSDSIYEKLISLIDNFEVNQCIFPKEELPEAFTRQVIEFMEKILELNTNHNEIQNMLMTCITDPSPVIKKATKCDYYMSPTYVSEIQESRIKEWIKMTDFK